MKKHKNEEQIGKPVETFEKLHNKKPVTRRDFLATGLIPFSAAAIMPNWLHIFSKAGVAEAQELVCKAAGTQDLCAYVGIKLSGGAGLSANFLPHDKGMALLKSYSKMGMGLGATVPVTIEFANKAPFYANSGIIAGIRTTATALTLQNTVCGGVCVRSQDDSSNNASDFTGLVSKAGISGKILPGLGTARTDTGVNARPAFVRPSAPLIVSNYAEIPGSLGVSGSLAALSADQKSKLFRTVQSLTASQVDKLNSLSGGSALSNLIQCANQDNTKLISNAAALDTDPLGNPAFAAVWGINNNTSRSSRDFVFATLVYNAINGNAGTVNLEVGGFDYHNNTRTSGDAKDLEAGLIIGRVIQSFAVMNKKGFVSVCSDGSVSSSESDVAGSPWVSDRGTAGLSMFMGYDPLGAHATDAFQVGYFTDQQVVDDTTAVGGSSERGAGAIFVNYLAFNGKVGLVETYLPRIFTTDEINQVNIFA